MDRPFTDQGLLAKNKGVHFLSRFLPLVIIHQAQLFGEQTLCDK